VNRDELERFGSELPGVTAVHRVETQGHGAVVQLEHDWQGDTSVFPRALDLLLPSKVFRWRDQSRWDEATLTGSWRLWAPHFGRAVTAEGVHRFEPDGDGARVIIEGELDLAAAEVLGSARVDDFLQALFARVVERATSTVEDYLGQTAQ
jgi:hypothetical protein